MHSRSKNRRRRTLTQRELIGILAVLAVVIIGTIYSAQQQGNEQQPKVSETSVSSSDDSYTGASLDDPGMSAITTVLDSVIDGDTIRTEAGKVRLIGIDTPERGECGYNDAAELILEHVTPGDTITLLLPDDQNKADKYDRLIRFVVTADGTDLSLLQLRAGNAVARYDSLDGYPPHPHEQEYRAAQLATSGADRSVQTTACAAS